MLKLLLPLLLFLGVAEAAQPPLYWGPNNTTQTVTSGLNLNGKVSIYSGTQDPSVTATIGVEGDLFIRYGASGGQLYIKQDIGTTTNWTYLFAGTPGTGTGDVLHTGNAFGADVSLGATDAYGTHLIAGGVAKLDALAAGINLLDNTTLTYSKALKFPDSGANVISVKAPATAASSFPIILPEDLPGSGTDCVLIDSAGQLSHSPCYSGISSVGPGTSLVSGSFNVKSIIGTNNISITDNGDGSISIGETNTHLPGTGTVQSVALYVDDTAAFSVSGSPISSNGEFHINTMIQGAGTVWAAPKNSNGQPTFRKVVKGDISSESELADLVMVTDGMGGFNYETLPGALPHVVWTFNGREHDVTLQADDVGAVIADSAPSNQWMTGVLADGSFTYSQPAFSNISGRATIAQITSGAASANQVPVSDGAGNATWGPLPVVNTVIKTSNYNAPALAEIILGNTTGGSFNINLPDISATDGVILEIKNIGTNDLTITGNSGQLIDSDNVWVLTEQYSSIKIVSKSGAWYVL